MPTATATPKQPAPATEPEAPKVQVFNETIKIAAYGRYGSRKTEQISTLIAEFGPENVLVVSAEHGLGTIRSKLKEEQVLVAGNFNELRTAFAKAIEWSNRPGETKDRWIAVDGMSQITEWLANEQLSGAEKFHELKAKGQTIPTNLLAMSRYINDRGNIDSMRIYGRIGRDSENLLASWIALPTNLYVNYLEDMTGSSGFEKTLPYGPDVPGKVGLKAVMSSFDFVMRYFYGENEELIAGLNSASNLYMARTREDRTLVSLPPEIHNFNLAKFVKLIRGEIKLGGGGK